MVLIAESSVSSSSVLVFIPMYNCAPQIGRVLAQLRRPEVTILIDGVVCIDNRSQDETVENARTALEDNPVSQRWLLRNDENYGLGGSHKVAIDFARDKGFSYLIVLHGDDQGDIGDLIPHLQSAAHEATDFLLGARFMKGSRLIGYSRLRTALNKLINVVFSALVHKPVHDIGSGLNLFRVRAFADGFERKFADDLTFNLYLVFGIAAKGLRMTFFPLSWREDDQVSNARLARISLRVLRLLAARILRAGDFLRDEHRDVPRAAYPSTILHAWGPE